MNMFNNKDPLDQAVLGSIAVFGALLVVMAGWHAVTGPDPEVADAPAAQEVPADTETAQADTAQPEPAPSDTAQTETAAAEPAAEQPAEAAPAADASAEPAASEEPQNTETASAEPAAEEPAPSEEADTAAAESEAPAAEETDTAAAEPEQPAASGESDTAAAEPEAPAETDTAASDGAATGESQTAADEQAPASEELEATAAASTSGAFPEAQMAYLEGDAEAGAKIWNQCRACHVADQEQNRVGPHLVNIVGRDTASIESFNYSEALQGHQGEQWTPEHLDAWLTNPREYAQGTKMSYPGVKDEEDRGNLLAYLWSLQN